MARYPEAESALRWALALRERNLGLEDPLTAQSLDQLAALDSDLGRFEEADILESRAVGIDRQINPIPAGLASLLIHAGEIDLRLQKNTQALESLTQGLGLMKNAASPAGLGSLKVEALWAAARADLRLGKISEASSALHQALNEAKQDSPLGLEEGDALMRLADFDLAQKNQAQASAGYQSALKIYQHFVGPDTSYPTLPYISRLAEDEEALGNDADAMALWKRVLETSQSVYGPSHPQTAVFLSNLARTEESLGDPSSAAQHLKAALAILKTHYDPDHPLIRETEGRLAKLAGH
jgi:tetratricopeptide (TPR) repeat protein